MNSQILYVGLGAACLVMLVAIFWLTAVKGKPLQVPGVTKPEPSPSVPVLAPSHDQLFMTHVAPVFEDKLNKELTAKQAEALYNAYKGVKIEVKS